MVTRWLLAVCGVIVSASVWCTAAEAPARDVQGIHLGTRKGMVFVARDKKTWEAVKEAIGKPQAIPKGGAKPESLDRLDDVDFGREMIVAVFWGEMSFSGQGEKCIIEKITAKKAEIEVACQAKLWGGAVKHAYRAWPFHVRVVPGSDLPVRFTQATHWIDTPDKFEKPRSLGVIQRDEWKQIIPLPQPGPAGTPASGD